MAEEVVDQQEEAQETPDSGLNELIAKLEKSMDERYSGFQSLLDKKTSELASQFEELKISRMTPAERERFEEEQSDQRIARLERENQILKRAKDHPAEVGFLMSLLEKDSLDAQIELVRELTKAKTEEATPREEPEVEPEPVNMNNPKRKSDLPLSQILQGGKMTKEAAEKLLASQNERGALARLRGG